MAFGRDSNRSLDGGGDSGGDPVSFGGEDEASIGGTSDPDVSGGVNRSADVETSGGSDSSGGGGGGSGGSDSGGDGLTIAEFRERRLEAWQRQQEEREKRRQAEQAEQEQAKQKQPEEKSIGGTSDPDASGGVNRSADVETSNTRNRGPEGGDVRLAIESQNRAPEGGDIRLAIESRDPAAPQGGDYRLAIEERDSRNRRRKQPSRVSQAVEDVESTLGVDVPGSGPIASPSSGRTEEEQFGDFDWSFGFGDPARDEVETFVDELPGQARRATESRAETLFSEDVAGESASAEVTRALFGDSAAEQVDTFVRDVGVGVSSGTAQALAGVPGTALEAGEFLGFAATNPGETAAQLPDAAAEAAVGGAEGFLANPGRGTGGLLGGAAAGVGFGRFLGTTRVGQGASGRVINAADIDPASSAARGARRTAAGVRELYDDRRAQADLFGSQRSRSGSRSSSSAADDLGLGDELERMQQAQRGEFVGNERGEVPGSLSRGDVETVRQGSRLSSDALDRMSRSSGVPDTPTDDLRRLDQLDRQLAREIDDGRTARDVFTPEGLRVNEVRASDGVFGVGGAAGASVTADARSRQAAAQASSLDVEGTLFGGDEDLDIFAGGVTDTDVVSDVLGRPDTDTVTDVVVTPDTRTGTDTALFTPERVLTPDPDPELTPDPDPDPDPELTPDPDPELTPDPDPEQFLTPDPEPRRKREEDPFVLDDSAFGFDASEDVFSSGIQSSEDLLDDFGL